MFEVDKSYPFLLGLNDDLYSHIRGQILATEPLPSLEKIFNIVTQEEQHKKLMVRREDRTKSVAAFNVNHDSRTRAQAAGLPVDIVDVLDTRSLPAMRL